MAMNFWLNQQKAKSKTFWMLLAFTFLTLAVAYIADTLVRSFWPVYQTIEFPWIGFAFVAITVLSAVFNYARYKTQGGEVVAQTVGAYPVSRTTQNPAERQLLNIIEELCVATGLPMPAVYILKNPQINAFAAGLDAEKSCICVTTGSLNQLTREELQAVIAHECGHIYNGDMRLSMRLAALLMGFYIIFYLALRLVQFSPLRSNQNSRLSPSVMIALVLFGAGALSWLAGKILTAMISRQREYLADASSAQFTRNPEALVGALKKIEKETDLPPMPASGMAFSHLYFDNRGFISSIFATHPPLEKRIAALLGKDYL